MPDDSRLETRERMPSLGAAVDGSSSRLSLEDIDALLDGLFVTSGDLWKRQETLQYAASTMSAAVEWVHREIQRVPGAAGAGSTSIDAVWDEHSVSGSAERPRSSVPDGRAALVARLLNVFDDWFQQHVSRSKALPMALWLSWAELRSALSVLTAVDASAFPPELHRRGSQTASILARAASTVQDAQLPEGFPTVTSHCNKALQVDFCANLWSAVVHRSLQTSGGRRDEGPQHQQALDDVAVQLLTAFSAWTARAMTEYEVVFLAAVEKGLAELVGESARKLRVSAQVLKVFVSAHIAQYDGSSSSAAKVAVCALVAAALCAHEREHLALVDSLFSALRNDIAQKMTLAPLPHVQEPLGIVTAGLGMAAWIIEPDNGVPSSWARVVMTVFAITRVTALPLLAPRIVTDERRLEEATQHMLAELRSLLADQAQRRGNMVELIYRVLESGVGGTISFFHSSSAQHTALLTALQSAMPSELFRSALTSYVANETKKSADASLPAGLPSTTTLKLLKHLYDVAAPVLLDLSAYPVDMKEKPYEWLVRSFVLLTRLEFAREAWTSPSTNEPMSTVTQRIEQAIDLDPDAVFGAIFRLVNGSLSENGDLWPGSKVFPDAMDIVQGCQVLAVSLLIQRKLRALLIQSTNPQLRDDAIAVVFLGVNSAYEPVDSFAHRFLGVCLSHLGQFVSMYSIAPYYVQLSLPAFPSTMSQQTIAAVCGSVFGALLNSQASAEDRDLSSPSVQSGAETARGMTLWAMKQFLNRSKELLLADDDTSSDMNASSGISDGLYLVGLMAEITKMTSLALVDKAAMEMEALVRDCDQFDLHHRRQVNAQVKRTIFTSISQNCEAEKRAWLAAWFIELETQYPTVEAEGVSTTENAAAAAATSRL